jgi:hypothetical protein
MKAYELLKSHRQWTRGAFARTARGVECDAADPRAVRWCLLGALQKCTEGHEYDRIRAAIRRELCTTCIAVWNDERATYDEVIRLLRRLDL